MRCHGPCVEGTSIGTHNSELQSRIATVDIPETEHYMSNEDVNEKNKL